MEIVKIAGPNAKEEDHCLGNIYRCPVPSAQTSRPDPTGSHIGRAPVALNIDLMEIFPWPNGLKRYD